MSERDLRTTDGTASADDGSGTATAAGGPSAGESVAAAPVEVAAGAPGGVAPTGFAVRGRRSETLYFAFRNPKVVGALVVIVAFGVLGLVGPWFYPHDTGDFVGVSRQGPSAEHWFGTTALGADVFAQFVVGLRATFVVGLLGGGIAAVVGMTIGFVAGYRGGWIDELLNMLTNIVLVIPGIAVLMILHTYFGINSVPRQGLFIGLFSWPWVARAVRAQTFSLRNRDFVDLAKLSGVPARRIIRREIAPNMNSYLVMTFILLFGGAVLFAATLDFIGLGPPGQISLGLMMNRALQQSALIYGFWWWFIPPGVGITAIVGSMYVMNVGLDEVFNPKLREM